MKSRSYKIGPKNSTVNGSPGRLYDWNSFCWDGSEIYIGCWYPGHHKEKRKAPLPFTDDHLIGLNSQYLHVPYAWTEHGTVFRVRPNKSMQAGSVFRGLRVEKQTAVKKEDGWYWILEGERTK